MDREIIREEVRKALNEMSSPASTSRPTNAPQLNTVVNRARQLISMNSQQMSTAARSVQNYPKRRRLGHTYQKKQKPGEDKIHELVCLLPYSGSNSKAFITPDYNLRKEDIYLSGAVTLNTLDEETDVRRKIVEVLSTRIDNIASNDFEFVKVLRKTVTSPAIKEGQESNYAMVKTYMGQGKLYIQLTKSPNESPSSGGADVFEVVHDTDESNNRGTPSTSTATEDEDNQMLNRLKVIFPDHPEDRLLAAVKDSITIDDAINDVLDGPKPAPARSEGTVKLSRMATGRKPINKTISTSSSSLSGTEILAKFREGIVESDKVFPINFNRSKKPMQEICRIYKTNLPNLARQPIVYFLSESGDDQYEEEAADVGGPKREFFHLVSEQMLSSTNPQLFEGETDHKVPVHSQQLLLQDYFKMIGKVFAHSFIHGDTSVVGLAKPVKVFLQTGCEESASRTVTMEDIPDLNVREMLQDIRAADENKIEAWNSDDSLLGMLSECGISAAFLTPNNANQVVYDVMVYQVVQKRIRELQSIREGLGTLHVDVLLNSHPKVMPLLFPTTCEAKVDVEVLKIRIKRGCTNINNKKHDIAFNFFMDYLDEVSTRSEGIALKDVLLFITGSSVMPDGITIDFHEEPLPDPDTCTKSLKVPTQYGIYEAFKSAFDSTISIQGKGYGRI